MTKIVWGDVTNDTLNTEKARAEIDASDNLELNVSSGVLEALVNLNMQSNAITNADSVTTEKTKTSQGVVWDRTANDSVVQATLFTAIEPPSSVTSTSFASIADMSGAVDDGSVPSGANLYGRFTFFTSSSVDQNGTVRPQFRRGSDDSTIALDSLSVSVSSGDTFSLQDSGWTEITETTGGDIMVAENIQAKLSTQSNGDSISFSSRRVAVAFEWRLS